jgi:hypothetical protein
VKRARTKAKVKAGGAGSFSDEVAATVAEALHTFFMKNGNYVNR